ncbi:MAG: rhomboid family intramembrane serine protease [bacterium]
MIPLTDTLVSNNRPIVNNIIILTNFVIFIFQFFLPAKSGEALIKSFGLIPANIDDPLSYFSFITSIFLHAGIFHLIGNMWTLYIFGKKVEDKMGSINYLFFYLLNGVLAGVAHFLFYNNSNIPVVGASGAISGVLGAYMFMFPYSRIIFMIPVLFIPYLFQMNAFFYMIIWFLIQLFSGTISLITQSNDPTGIAFWAHIGGFIGGITLHKHFKRNDRKNYYHDDDYQWMIY